jgi:hypothetical protein
MKKESSERPYYISLFTEYVSADDAGYTSFLDILGFYFISWKRVHLCYFLFYFTPWLEHWTK